LTGLGYKRRDNAGGSCRNEHESKTENGHDRARTGQTSAFKKIDDGVKQISQDARHSKRPKDWRKEAKQFIQSPDERGEQTQQNRNRKPGKPQPNQARLTFGWRRKVHSLLVTTARQKVSSSRLLIIWRQ
jgi:hypothetical protein